MGEALPVPLHLVKIKVALCQAGIHFYHPSRIELSAENGKIVERFFLKKKKKKLDDFLL